MAEGGEITRKGTLRIYQLKKDSLILMQFISLAERKKGIWIAAGSGV
ncbi:hypothetical protein [Anaeromicropila populeti]|nr:hypothetical protein [Anaeromicropila populeti]